MVKIVLTQMEGDFAAITGYVDKAGITASRLQLDVLESPGGHVHLKDLLDDSPAASGCPVVEGKLRPTERSWMPAVAPGIGTSSVRGSPRNLRSASAGRLAHHADVQGLKRRVRGLRRRP